MNITIIGTGYVGLPSGVGFAELGHKVICVDHCEQKISSLKQGQITLYEDGLEELFHKNTKNKNLTFTTDTKEAVKNAEVVLIAVGTPPHPETQEADMKYIYAAASEVAKHLDEYTVIAVKSTVPVGTGEEIEEILRTENPQADFDVVSLPEFLREGFAVYDFFNPDRIVIGSNSERATAVLKKLYLPFEGKTNILYVNRRSSETIKYASNAFLAMKIHYINEMADFCEKSGADIAEVAKGMGLDSRIGDKFLSPGPGFGGSCFPKDTQAMSRIAEQHNAPLTLVNAVILGNIKRQQDMAKRILSLLENKKSPKIAILGLAFKSGTDDCRESPAINIINAMLVMNPNIKISAFDPKAMENAKTFLGSCGAVSFAESPYSCAENADLLAILTEWPDFLKLNMSEIKALMRHPLIVDLKNLFVSQNLNQQGFQYESIGKTKCLNT